MHVSAVMKYFTSFDSKGLSSVLDVNVFSPLVMQCIMMDGLQCQFFSVCPFVAAFSSEHRNGPRSQEITLTPISSMVQRDLTKEFVINIPLIGTSLSMKCGE